MKKTMMNDLFNMLDEWDIICIAREFSVEDDSDLDFEDRSTAMKYIAKFAKASCLKDKKSQELFIECIGDLVGYSKSCDQFKIVANALEEQTSIRPFLGFDELTDETFRYSNYKNIRSIFMKEKFPKHKTLDLVFV